jgi:hypothetical protein
MKTMLGGITAVAIFFSSACARAEQSDMTLEVDCADTLVIGAPSVMTVTILNRNPAQSPFSVPRIDLASEIDQGVALAFKFESDSRAAIQVGYPMYGLPEVEIGPRPPRIDLNAGERVTFIFDLDQLLFGGQLREGRTIPPGKYRMTAMFFNGTWTSAPREVTIREPTPDEKRFLEAMHKQGVGKKWFPAVITDDNLQVPDDIPLPAETAQLRDFIKVLRLAVRNPDAAAKQIEDKKDSWGYLQDAVTELKYECVAKAKGKDSAAAQDIRRTLDADAKTKGRLTRLEKAGGLLDHFAEIRAAKPKDK